MNNSNSFDVIIIGSGPGGQKAAIQAAKIGKRVAIIEKDLDVGGECLFHGTIPSKTFREAALNVANIRRNSTAFNFEITNDLEIRSLITRLDHVVDTHKASIQSQLKRNNVTLIHGKGRLATPNSVEVLQIDGSILTLHTEYIVIATGSRPRQPDGIEIDHEHILDSDSILSIIYLPQSLTVLGGGVIASEYASIFAHLGVKVTIVDRAPRPLMFMDPEMVQIFTNHFQEEGGMYYGDQEIATVEWDGVSQVVTKLNSGHIIKSDKMLVALGRIANVKGLGLDNVGIKLTERGHIQANEFYQTSMPNIYAVGDVIGRPSLAATAMEQGRRAICHALNIDISHDEELMPIGIYSIPELASIGLSEAAARAEYGDILVGKADMKEVVRAQISGATSGMLKLITTPDGKKLLGVHIVSEGASDLIHAGELAIINHNDVKIFLDNVLNFPTMSQAYRIAALDIHNQLKKRQSLALEEAV